GEPGKVVELARRRAELRGQVHSGNPAPVFRSDPAGRPADPAADIEQIIARLWLEPSDQLLGCDRTLPVEMVYRREGLRRDRRVRAIRVSKRSQHALGDALTRIVLPDRTPVSQLSLRPQLNAEVPSRIPMNSASVVFSTAARPCGRRRRPRRQS